MSEPSDEFSFLPAQAADWGIEGPLPRGERVWLALPDGRKLSALRYGPSTGSGTEGGSGTAAPVVTFLHGAGLNAHTWDSTILALGLPALAIDLPGHGDSAWRDDAAYVASVLAPDIAAGIAAWTDAPQVLVGQSLGGLTAAAVAASFPELVRELVVLDITPGISRTGGPAQLREFFGGPRDWASRDELVDRALSFGLGGSRAAAERGVFHNSRVRDDGRVEWKHHFARLANAAALRQAQGPEGAQGPEPEGAQGPGPEGALRQAQGPGPEGDALAAVLSDSGWHDLAGVTAPLLLIRGDHGYVTESDAADFAQRLPQASVEVVSSGHNVQEEIPVELGARLQRLVRSD